MISQIYRFFLTISLISFFSFVLSFGIAVENSWAATPFSQLVTSPYIQIAGMDRAKAVTKDIEGKAQEAIGNVTGNVKNQAAGKAKQVEATARNKAEDVKDEAKNVADSVKEMAKDAKDAMNK